MKKFDPMTAHVDEVDRMNGTRCTVDWDPEGILVIKNEQDVTAIIDQNKRYLSGLDQPHVIKDPISGRGVYGRMIAMVPDIILLPMIRSGMIKDKKAMHRWVNDPANRYFRCTNETV